MSVSIVKGGKKKRRGKNINLSDRAIDFATKDQVYGETIKILGNGRFIIKCYNNKPNGEFESYELICSVRGKMRRRIYINLNDIVIVSLRDFQANRGDIVHKYTYEEINTLYKNKLIPSYTNKEEADVDFINNDTNVQDKMISSYKGYSNNDLIRNDYSDEEYEYVSIDEGNVN